jgi:hypothetical protein
MSTPLPPGCTIGDPADLWDTDEPPIERNTEPEPAYEYAIRFPGGALQTGWDDYLGEFVQTWDSREDADRELARIQVCGITLRPGGGVDRDPQLCGAHLVRRQVTPWGAL